MLGVSGLICRPPAVPARQADSRDQHDVPVAKAYAAFPMERGETMIPPAFEYLRPKTIPEALAFLKQHGENAKILSGGQSLIPMMKLRLARPAYIVDLNRIAGLSYIKEEGG